MCLKRHIVSVDLRTVANAQSAYQVIQSPCILKQFKLPKEVIIVLEEFDTTILELHKREQEENSLEFIAKPVKKPVEIPAEKKDTMGIKICSPSDDQNRSINSFEVFDDAFNPLDRSLKVRDLLDILQGTAPLSQSIIIATTNKFDEIYDICPELFRPGRLTPVFFGYLEYEQLDQMCKYHFNQSPPYFEGAISIPTSHLIEKLLEYKIKHDQTTAFNKFIQFIETTLNKKTETLCK
jgi:hypothetical protein